MFSTAKCLRAIGLLAIAVTAMGCPKDAIDLSKTTLDFQNSRFPEILTVWNNNPDAGRIDIVVKPSPTWIVVNTQLVSSSAPVTAAGPYDEKTVQVSIDRTRLSAGQHMGKVTFSADGIVPREVMVMVNQATDGTLNDLNVVNPVVNYSSPYLIDFSFSLHNRSGEGVVQNPSAFTITAREGTDPLPGETGVHLRRGAARQLKTALILDYTQSMQSASGAIAAMEGAAQETLLPALNEDALISVTEFHREDLEALEIVPFTVDREYINAQIDAVQGEIVQGFAGASRLFDTLFDVVGTFDVAGADKESRYAIIFTDGGDTSSTRSANDVVERAKARDVRIYAIDFGTDEVASDLIELTVGTGGMLFTAETVAVLDQSFQRIVRDLDGQYNLRWASLARNSTPFFPAFTLSFQGNAVSYTAPDRFTPSLYGGDGVLRGKLRFITSESQTATTAFLRADYVPRAIRQFKITLARETAFTVEAVDAANYGLLADWDLVTSTDPVSGAKTYNFTAPADPNDPIPFGTFGPMLRVEFATLLPEGQPLFDAVYVDNSVYPEIGGVSQSFEVAGYTNTPPAR